MVKHIILSIALVFSIYSPLVHAMEIAQVNLDNFTTKIAYGDSPDNITHTLRFRRVFLENLVNPTNDQEQKDRASFISILSDFEAVQNSNGQEVAEYIATLTPDVLLESYIQTQENKIKKMTDKKIMIHWIIEDIDNKDAFVGRMNLHMYVGDRPEDYKDTFLLAFALALTEKYRNQKFTSNYARDILRFLVACNEFKDAQFCFDIDQENKAMHKIAEKIGAKKIHSWERVVKLNTLNITRQSELFLIPQDFYIDSK